MVVILCKGSAPSRPLSFAISTSFSSHLEPVRDENNELIFNISSQGRSLKLLRNVWVLLCINISFFRYKAMAKIKLET